MHRVINMHLTCFRTSPTSISCFFVYCLAFVSFEKDGNLKSRNLKTDENMSVYERGIV